MSISAMVRRLRELAALKEQFPDIPIVLTGVGFYAPVLTSEQWVRFYGASLPATGTGGETPEASRATQRRPF